MARKTLETSVSDFMQALGKLVRRVRSAAAAHELSFTEVSVMGRLAMDGPATTAELARAEGMRPQSMGATIAALEEMGIIERTPHPTDGRQVSIALTTRGATVRKSAKDAMCAWLAQAITQLDEKDRRALFAASEVIKRLAES